MSEPLSTTEIEDVLSSIRRLVAEDLRPQVQPKSAPAEAARNKLILTPALRVVISDGAASDMAVIVSNLGSGLTQTDWDPEGDDTGELDTDLDGDAAQDLADHGWAFEHTAADRSDDVLVFLPSSPESLADEVPDAESPAVTKDDAGPTFVSIRRSGPLEEVPVWAQADEGGDLSTDLAGAEPPQPGAVDGTIEPDPEWADAAEADVLAELEVEDQDEAPPEFAASAMDANLDQGLDDAEDFGGEEPLYDEALLREIVRDLLREELQGTMGERITRNIRKLVRAEIARAFATQDLN